MASTGLGGPFPLTNEAIDEEITRTSPGAYALGRSQNGTFYVSYVGRSDSDVRSRIHNHVGHYPRFKYGYFGSPKAAFEKECHLWHDFGGPKDSLDNKNHPERPKGTNWKCPRCRIFD